MEAFGEIHSRLCEKPPPPPAFFFFKKGVFWLKKSFLGRVNRTKIFFFGESQRGWILLENSTPIIRLKNIEEVGKAFSNSIQLLKGKDFCFLAQVEKSNYIQEKECKAF